jgi:hypothetical protein
LSAPPLLPSLAGAVRGLSAVFWGLPVALLTAARMAMGDGWRALSGLAALPVRLPPGGQLALNTLSAVLPPAVALAVVLFGLRSLVRFQPQERVWTLALDRASIFNLLLLTLLPFAHWWNLAPAEPMFAQSVLLLVLSAVAFMLSLNHVLARLAAMLPDEVLRSDTRLFTRLNRVLILTLAALLLLEAAAAVLGNRLPTGIALLLARLEPSRQWLAIVLSLVPLALTMTLLWKAKEAIVTSVYRAAEH